MVICYSLPPKRCNLCGKRFDIYDANEDYIFERLMGYGTKYDGTLLNLHLCCNCMEQLIDKCKIPPVISFHTYST